MARLTFFAIGLLALTGATLAFAQSPRGENLSAGKTPAQLFASDCSACHRSPAGLAKGRGPGQIANFLVEHYTSSRQSAGLLGAYVASMRAAPPAAARTQPPAAGPTAAAGPRPPSEVLEAEPGGPALLQDERQAEPHPGVNGRARPGAALSRGRSQVQPGQRPETAAAAEPETRAETLPPAPPAPKTLDTLEVYD